MYNTYSYQLPVIDMELMDFLCMIFPTGLNSGNHTLCIQIFVELHKSYHIDIYDVWYHMNTSCDII